HIGSRATAFFQDTLHPFLAGRQSPTQDHFKTPLLACPPYQTWHTPLCGKFIVTHSVAGLRLHTHGITPRSMGKRQKVAKQEDSRCVVIQGEWRRRPYATATLGASINLDANLDLDTVLNLRADMNCDCAKH